MKGFTKSNKMKNMILLLVFASFLLVSASHKSQQEYYQITVYHYTTPEQEQVIDSYLEDALVPALHKIHLNNIGVFKSLANDTVKDKLLYVFITLKSLDELTNIPVKLEMDAEYLKAGNEYLNTLYSAPAFSRKETIVLQAFPLAPHMQKPQLKSAYDSRVYELRSYESASEKIFRNKVQMFNEGGEIDFFKRLNFNAVFYSSVIAGSRMPNLMYMTTFENMADRDGHWKKFVEDPFWKQLSSMPEYQNNISKMDIIFLRPTNYSDF